MRLGILWRIMEIEEGVIRRGRAYFHRSIDVKFIFDSARFGLSSLANILQIADVVLWVVFLLFLPFFSYFFA